MVGLESGGGFGLVKWGDLADIGVGFFMPTEEKAIEVEVVEVDGVAVPAQEPTPERETRGGREWGAWRQWQGRVRRLDSRWWPLWVLLGGVLVFLLLTLGLVLGAVMLVVRLVRGMFRGLAGLFR
jgi:hypothetical protein